MRVSPCRKNIVIALAALSVAGVWACNPKTSKKPADKATTAPAAATSNPNHVRLAVITDLAGFLAPSGCRKDMLGGLDHAAMLLDQTRSEVPDTVVLAVGPTFFGSPRLRPEILPQATWRAETIAEIFKGFGVAAVTVGANDLAAGPETLGNLFAASGAVPLAGNVKAGNVAFRGSHVVKAGNHNVGLAGASLMQYITPALGRDGATDSAPTPVEGAEVADLGAALKASVDELKQKGVQILVGMVSAPRSIALAAAAQVPELDVLLVGSPYYDQGTEGTTKLPDVVGKTLLVESPPLMQGIAIVDLHIKGDQLDFADGTGVGAMRERLFRSERIPQVNRYVASLKANGGDSKLIAEFEKELNALHELQSASGPSIAAPTSSYFQFRLEAIHAEVGDNPTVHAAIETYNARVTQENQTVLGSLHPPVDENAKATYVGVTACKECHEQAFATWTHTAHARGFKALVESNRQFDMECAACHTTAFDEIGGTASGPFSLMKSVQCEACHGPGSLHAKDKKKSSLLQKPTLELCQSCHFEPFSMSGWAMGDIWTHIQGDGHKLKSKSKDKQAEPPLTPLSPEMLRPQAAPEAAADAPPVPATGEQEAPAPQPPAPQPPAPPASP